MMEGQKYKEKEIRKNAISAGGFDVEAPFSSRAHQLDLVGKMGYAGLTRSGAAWVGVGVEGGHQLDYS